MNDLVEPFRSKALEALAGALAEMEAGRYNKAPNRAYYAAYHAAIVALVRSGFGSKGNLWGHDEVQARFAGELVRRRKVYSAELVDVLYDLQQRRNRADYGVSVVSRRSAEIAVRTAERFCRRLLEH